MTEAEFSGDSFGVLGGVAALAPMSILYFAWKVIRDHRSRRSSADRQRLRRRFWGNE